MAEEVWAVFVFRDRIFFERRATLKRIPVVERWYEWQTCQMYLSPAKWIYGTTELAQALLRSKKKHPVFDKDGMLTKLEIIKNVDQFAAILTWARTNELQSLTSHFSYEEMMITADYLCADIGHEGSDKPYYLYEVLAWRAGVKDPHNHRSRNPFKLLARAILWMTPAAIESLFTTIFMFSIIVSLAVVVMVIIHRLPPYEHGFVVCDTDFFGCALKMVVDSVNSTALVVYDLYKGV